MTTTGTRGAPALLGTLAALVTTACAAGAQGPAARSPHAVTPHVRALAGCYRVELGAWTPFTPGYHPNARALLREVRLDTVRHREARLPHAFRASPDIGNGRHERLFSYAPAWWPVGRDSLVVSWVDGFHGPIIVLRRRGAAWVGGATYVSDVVGETEPTAPARAVRVPCSGGSGE